MLHAFAFVTHFSVVLVEVVICGSPHNLDRLTRTYEIGVVVEGDSVVVNDAQCVAENIILIATRREYVVQKSGVRVTSRVYDHSVGDVHVQGTDGRDQKREET